MKNRAEFEHTVLTILDEINLLAKEGRHEEIQQKFALTIPYLKELRFLPNKRIDVSTINELLRNQANMMEMFRNKPPDFFNEE